MQGACLVVALLLMAMSTMTLARIARHQPKEESAGSQTQSESQETPVVNRDSLYQVLKQGFLAVEPIFLKGCFDCHSNKTRYPWYHSLPLIKGMIDSDIRNARKRIDFSNGMPFTKLDNAADILADIKAELQSGDMPPFSYRMMHWSAKPSGADADSVNAWLNRSLQTLSANGFEPTPVGEEGEQ